MAFDQAAFNAQWFPGTDPATGQALQSGGAPASAAATSVAPWQYGQGTNYAAGLQNTLQPMMQTMYPNGYLPGFSESFYLANNPDVRNAVAGGDFQSALQHYQQYGQREGRSTNPVVNRTMTGQGAPQMNYSPALTGFGFNPTTYMQNNPDVAAAVQSGQFSSPLDHYLKYGAAEGRGSTPFQYGGQTLFNQQMPNQYRQQQQVNPQSWRGMTGSPFGGQFGNMATMPMLSFLNQGLLGPGGQGRTPAAPSSFQIPNGTQTSAPPPPTGRDPGRGQSWYDNAYINGQQGWLSNGSQSPQLSRQGNAPIQQAQLSRGPSFVPQQPQMMPQRMAGLGGVSMPANPTLAANAPASMRDGSLAKMLSNMPWMF